MGLFKRLSDGFWSYVSPAKTDATLVPPQTISKTKKPAIPSQQSSLKDVIKRTRSMSPVERIDKWRVGSSSQVGSSVLSSAKRKRSTATRRGPGRPRKTRKMEDDAMETTPDVNYESDVVMSGFAEDEEINDDNDSVSSNIDVAHSRASQRSDGNAYSDDYDDLDTTLVVSEEDYVRNPPRKKLVSPDTEYIGRGITKDQLRAEGWDDDHIILYQKLTMRGYEPLMPLHWKFEYNFMPDALFAADDNAFISSVRAAHLRGSKALTELFELGGRVRDRIYMQRYGGQVRPEEQVRRMLKRYIKWAEDDAGLDQKTAIPLLALEMKPQEVHADVLQVNARRKLARLAARYREAFRVKQSIEYSPDSRTSTQLSYTLPTLYAIIASHTLIALVAYRPADDNPDIKTVAFFDMKDKNYDVWNALALAITVCHLRNVQIRIAEETGLGHKQVGYGQDIEEEDDPDA